MMAFVVQTARGGYLLKAPTELLSRLPLLPTIKPRFARKLPRVRFTGENSGCPGQTIGDYRREPRMD